MAKKRKGRSVRKNTNVNQEPEELTKAPHSFVIHKGIQGGHVGDLTKDFRKVMEPFTATALRERKKNILKDFVSVAGLLHVTHLCMFSRTELGTYLKIARLPRGPTLTFKVNNFALARDVVSSLKKQLVVEDAFKHSPLIVLNSFSGEGMHMKLMASTFQNMFPTINLTNVDLNSVRRCVLMNYNPATKLIDFRHYNIKVVPVGLSKGVKKVVQGKVPNLAKCNDISEFLTKSGMLSESEFEDDPNSHVTLSQKLISRGNIEQGQSAIRLSELGPRMSLQLIKIEDGLLDGEVLYHELVSKTEEEKQAIRKQRDVKKKIKEKRKRIQDENTKLKDAQKQQLKEKSLKGMQTQTDLLMKKASREAHQDAPVEEDDDAEYYKEEVGEEPDKDLFSKMATGTKRPPKTFHSYKGSKKPRLDDRRNSEGRDKPFSKHGKDFKKGNGKDFKKGNGKDFKKGNGKDFKKGNKRPGGKRVDKTNSHNRDFRPIGGVSRAKKNVHNKFKRSKK